MEANERASRRSSASEWPIYAEEVRSWQREKALAAFFEVQPKFARGAEDKRVAQEAPNYIVPRGGKLLKDDSHRQG
jgi:hypothetical protein